MTEDETPAHAQQDEQQSVDMRVDPARARELVENLSQITARISATSQGRPVRLLAVSKLKPASDILALHDPASYMSSPASTSLKPHLHFGENYAQELTQKAAALPRSIRWHFTGGLQTNKCRELTQIPNLWSVESVDKPKKVDALEKGRRAWLESLSDSEGQASGTHTNGADNEDGRRLGIHIQINTSGEESKSGISPSGDDALDLCRHVLTACPHLKLRGLMTIGAIARSTASSSAGPDGINEDFRCLKDVRERVLAGLKEDGFEGEALDLELSMGMSADFEDAIRQGSHEVRVGSQIFGERMSKEDAKAKKSVEKA